MGVRSLIGQVSLGGLVMGAVLSLASIEAAAACKGHKHTATGSPSSFQYLASVSAKNAWKARVKAHDGPGYTYWWAKNKRVVCTKSGPGSTWVCIARARPCK